jgi:CheY-like chemotaxis protein
LAHSLEDVLLSFGHQVCVAYDGRTALELVQGRRPDIVIADINMPELDGLGLARSIRRLPQGGGAHLIALTGNVDTEDALKSRDAGFGAHLAKPVNVDKLEALIKSFMGDNSLRN